MEDELNRRPRRAAGERGLTLVELAAVMAVLAVLVGSAMPSWQRFLDRRALEAAAAQLGADLQLMRNEAVARGETLRLAVQSDASASCYVVHTGAAGACTCLEAAAVQCTDDARALRRARFDAASDGLRLRGLPGELRVDPRQGTFSPTGTLRLQSREGSSIAHVVNLLGRVRTCASAASGNARAASC